MCVCVCMRLIPNLQITNILKSLVFNDMFYSTITEYNKLQSKITAKPISIRQRPLNLPQMATTINFSELHSFWPSVPWICIFRILAYFTADAQLKNAG